jgi:hypothetical protein
LPHNFLLAALPGICVTQDSKGYENGFTT